MQEDQTLNRDDQGDEFEANADDEYQVWKKNAPLLYDTLVSHLLEWPSLTCQFMPLIEEIPDSQFVSQKLVIGTNTSENEQNYLLIVNSRLPNSKGEPTSGQNNLSFSKSFENGLKPGFSCLEIETKIAHPGEINKARYAYGASNLIATKGINGNVYLFDTLRYPKNPNDGEYYPQMILVGHTTQGFALDWKLTKELQIISGDNDGNILFWDLEKTSTEALFDSRGSIENENEVKKHREIRMSHLRKFENNGKAVNEVKFHKINSNYFACASEDSTISFWDLRAGSNPFIKVMAHHTEVFSLDFSYNDEFLLLSGAADGLVKLWDMRKMVKPIHDFENHTDKVLRVEWNPSNESLFASSSEDKTVNIWDCSKIGDDIVTEDHPDGPPELLFKHKGHKGRVDDICWNPLKELGIMSTDSSNLIQLWEIDEGIYYDDI
jgi:histone-binding protein RBBP4